MVKTIAVLITCHNRVAKTIACLASLYAQEYDKQKFRFDVYLVDDGSTDNTSEQVQIQFPQVKIIKGDGKLFWNRGMHLAWSEASKKHNYDYYLWLNDDTLLFPFAIEDLLVAAEKTNDEAIICGTTKSADNGSTTYGGRLIKGGLITPNGEIQLCDYFNGNCVLIPKKVFDIVGNLDYTFNHALGDWDYGLRAKQKNIKAFVSAQFVGLCEKHASLQKWCSPAVPLLKRIEAFKSPLSVNPYQYFKFDKRHNGYISAVTHFISIHLRLLFPHFWTFNNKNL